MYIINNAKFDPFSYQEMLQPVAMATQTHQQLEDQYNDLNTRSNVWDQVTQNPKEDYARKLYEGYTKDLNTQVSDLMKTGLTPNSRAGLNTMRSRYTKEIVPIETAYNRRKELSDKQRELQEKDNTVFFNKNAADYTISDFIKNPNIQTQTQSGKALEEESMKVFENLKKEVRKNPDQWNKILQGQYFQNDKVEGYSSAEIYNTLARSEKGSQIINGIIDQITNTSAAAQWGDPIAYLKARRAVEKGAWSAIGTTDIKTLDNKYYDYALKHKDDVKDNVSQIYRDVPTTTVDDKVPTTEINNDMKFLQGLKTNNGWNELNKVHFSNGKYDNPGLKRLELLINKYNQQKENNDPIIPNNVDFTSTTKQSAADLLKGLANKNNTNNNKTTISTTNNKPNYNILINNKNKEDNYLDKDNSGQVLNTPKNIKLLNQTIKNMELEVKKSAVRDFTSKMNITDYDLTKKVIQENIQTFENNSGNTGLYKYEDGKKGKAIDSKNVNEYFGKTFSLDYDPKKGIILNSTVDNKHKSAIIDPELIDDNNRTIHKLMDKVTDALNNDDFDLASRAKKELVKHLHSKFNTLSKTQGSTISSKEEKQLKL